MAGNQPKKSRRAPAGTPEARENQLIALATDLAEKQLLEGTASSQVITHFLKLASTRETLEKERLIAQNNLLRKQVDALEANERLEALYSDALNAMRAYSGQEPDEPEDYYED